MAEVKCGTCSFRVANKCRILGGAVAVDADCSLTPSQRKTAYYQLKRIIGTPGGSRAVEIISIDACGGPGDSRSHLHITYSIGGGPTQTRTIDRDIIVAEMRDQDTEEQFVSALAATLAMVDPSSAAETLTAITGGVFYIG